MMLRILGRRSSINVRKVTWCCGELGLDYGREDWGGAFASTHCAEFLALNPNGLVPVLVDENGALWESNTICRYLAAKHGRHDLLPAQPRPRAVVEQWMDWQAGDLSDSWQYAFLALVRRNPEFTDPARIAASTRAWNDKMALLDRHLEQAGGFVAGDGFTLADLLMGLATNRWLKTPQEHGDFPAARDHHRRMAERAACVAHGGFDEP